jgi:Domain of unknown function DUF29
MGEHDIKLHGLAAGQPSGPRYREDYAAWIAHQLVLLHERRVGEIDYDNLIDEVGDLGSNVWDKYVSALEIVLLHMLNWDFQPQLRSRSWQGSILEHRDRAIDVLADNPSFKSRQADAVARAFRYARTRAVRETQLPLKTFPEICPYDWDAILTRSHPLPGDDA